MKPKKIPLRMCVGCQEMKAKKELLRVVRSPEGEIVLDPTGKKPAGVHICAGVNRVWPKHLRKKRLERALKQQISADVYNALRAGIIE